MNKASFPFWLAVCSVCATSPVWGQVFRCVDANDHVTYTNVAGEGKNCKRLQVEPAVTPTNSARVADKRPGAAATPAGFPRVSQDAQRARDETRRSILNQELSNEEQGLQAAKQELADQEKIREGNERNYQRVLDRLQPYKDEVARRERNIEAINRELSSLR
jgi:septal ring factor EnvC (AmiA/AmiB activator)